jgi:hypothetical protein
MLKAFGRSFAGTRLGTSAKLREQSQGDCNEGCRGLRDEHHLAAIKRIGDHATDQRKNNHRQNPRQPHSTECNRLIGERANMPEQRPDLHLGSRDRK